MPWIHARSIDYHDRNPWAVVWVALSPLDEAFVYREWSVNLNKWVNKTIAQEISELSGQEKFVMNLIDPLANKMQTDSGISTIEDLNRLFYKLQAEGIGTGGYWEPYDTKGLKGRDEIKKRLKNSLRVGKPFNNEVIEEGAKVRLPTIWFSRYVPETIKSIRHWRYEEWQGRTASIKDKKEAPIQKFSHFCTALEGVFKDIRWRVRKDTYHIAGQGTKRKVKYFRGR